MMFWNLHSNAFSLVRMWLTKEWKTQCKIVETIPGLLSGSPFVFSDYSMILSHLGVTYSFEKLVQIWVIFPIIYTHILSLSLRTTLYTLLADFRAGTQTSALSTVFLFGSANKRYRREAARLEEEEETCSFLCASCSHPMDILSAYCSCENHCYISSHWWQQVLPQHFCQQWQNQLHLQGTWVQPLLSGLSFSSWGPLL